MLLDYMNVKHLAEFQKELKVIYFPLLSLSCLVLTNDQHSASGHPGAVQDVWPDWLLALSARHDAARYVTLTHADISAMSCKKLPTHTRFVLFFLFVLVWSWLGQFAEQRFRVDRFDDGSNGLAAAVQRPGQVRIKKIEMSTIDFRNEKKEREAEKNKNQGKTEKIRRRISHEEQALKKKPWRRNRCCCRGLAMAGCATRFSIAFPNSRHVSPHWRRLSRITPAPLKKPRSVSSSALLLLLFSLLIFIFSLTLSLHRLKRIVLGVFFVMT